MQKRSDFFENTQGVNITDSPFFVKDGQAMQGYNYDYDRTGGFRKRRGLTLVNSAVDTYLRTLGIGIHNTSSGTKTVVRAADRKLQTVDTTIPSFTVQTEDTAATNSDFFEANSQVPVRFVNFNTPSANVMWATGGGATSVYGYTGSKITKNGSETPTGILSTSVSGSAGTWTSTGTYYVAVAARKASTQVLSNADLDVQFTVASTTNGILYTFPAIDTTKYDMWYVYRSVVSGVTDFTTGTLVALVPTTTPTYLDNGNPIVASAQNVPRAGNTVLDNSVLPAGTYNTITAFKRRLAVSQNSSFYLSDLDKSESWPIGNKFTIPSGGNITAAGIVGFNTQTTTSSDEKYVLWKETEMWEFDGTSIADWELKFVANCGSANQNLIVSANGYLFWIDYRGIYMWNGSGKPIRLSRPIEALFGADGDLDKTKLNIGWGEFYRKQNQIIWYVSHRVKGENKLAIKLDLRLTLPQATSTLEGNEMEGVFSLDSVPTSLYAGRAYLPSSYDESFLVGDAAGYIYQAYYGASDYGNGIDFSYDTKPFTFGTETDKRFHKVIVWVDAIPNQDLTLGYWTQYKSLDTQQSTSRASMEPTNDNKVAALWDLATWDISNWDEYIPQIKGLVFNLSSTESNAEGYSLRLRFSQTGANQPCTIYGFSVFWSDKGATK